MKGLAPHTLQVFEAVSKLDCIKSYLLVGGDLDFMKWRTSKTEKMEVAWYQIEKQ